MNYNQKIVKNFWYFDNPFHLIIAGKKPVKNFLLHVNKITIILLILLMQNKPY